MTSILDPNNTQQAVSSDSTPGILPKHIREFGFYPRMEEFRTGDILLFEPINLQKQSKLIQKVQSSKFADVHSRWTHAAIYIYDGTIIEALPFKGVIQSHIENYISQHYIKIRRFHFKSENDYLKYHIAFTALKKVGTSYDVHRLTNIAFSLMSKRNIKNLGFDRRYTICSQICFDSILEATQVSLDECPPAGPVLPAHLSLSKTLYEVDLNWATIKD